MFLLVNTLGRTSVVLNINCQILVFILRGSLTLSILRSRHHFSLLPAVHFLSLLTLRTFYVIKHDTCNWSIFFFLLITILFQNILISKGEIPFDFISLISSFWSCWKMKGITVLRIVKICVSFQALILGFPLWVMPLLPSYQAVRSQRKLQSVVIKKNYKITTLMQWHFQPM